MDHHDALLPRVLKLEHFFLHKCLAHFRLLLFAKQATRWHLSIVSKSIQNLCTREKPFVGGIPVEHMFSILRPFFICWFFLLMYHQGLQKYNHTN